MEYGVLRTYQSRSPILLTLYLLLLPSNHVPTPSRSQPQGLKSSPWAWATLNAWTPELDNNKGAAEGSREWRKPRPATAQPPVLCAQTGA